jgi:predicted nucleotidyltransferase
MIDLAPAHLATVLNLLAAHAPDCEVRAFGSRVTGAARAYSDLDLAILAPAKIPLTQLAALREAFQESDLPMRVDVLDWECIGEAFRQVIEKSFEVLQHPTPVTHVS